MGDHPEKNQFSANSAPDIKLNLLDGEQILKIIKKMLKKEIQKELSQSGDLQIRDQAPDHDYAPLIGKIQKEIVEKVRQEVVEEELIEQVSENLKHLEKCVRTLEKAAELFTEDQYETLRKVLKDEHELHLMEYETNLETLSTIEKRLFHKRLL